MKICITKSNINRNKDKIPNVFVHRYGSGLYTLDKCLAKGVKHKKILVPWEGEVRCNSKPFYTQDC